MKQINSSIFDLQDPQELEKFKLWARKTPIHKLLDPTDLLGSSTSEPYLIKSKIGKKSSDSKIIKDRVFFLTSRYLFYQKTGKLDEHAMAGGVLDVKWARVLFEKCDASSGYEYLMKIIKNQRFTTLFLKNEQDMNDWKIALRKVTVLTDFHDIYEPISDLGSGGFAKGFSKKYLGTKKNGQNTLMSEIEMLRNLDHPNIIKLEEVYETENSVYVVQELCEGGSLLEGRTKLLNSEQAKIVLTQILAVIQYLSSKGIVHRDLKPYNILRKFKACDDVDNQLKIIDFGLVYNPRSRVDTSGKKCGTPGYIAPEILNHQKKGNSFDEEDKPSFDHITHEPELKLDGKVDVFSVGVIFYYMMTGVFPFDGISSKEVYDSNKKGNINFDIPEAKKVEPSAWDLVTKMLEIDPKLRLGPEEALNHPFLRVEQEDKVIQAEDMEIPNEWDVVDSDECNSRNDIPLFRSKMFKGGDNISRMVCAQGSKTSSGARSLLSVKMQLGKKMNASPHQSPNFSISSPLMSRRSNQARNRPSVLSRYTSNSSKSSRMKSSRACSRSSGSNGNIEESTKDSIKTQNVNYIQSKVVKASGQFTKSIFSTKK